ncbi:MAG TPA: multiheme c-type cytochrome [Pyrinomonadaceae bacterium]
MLALLLLLASAQLFVGQYSAERWKPRRLTAETEFVGDETCAECHKTNAASHAQSGMAHAMQTAGDSRVLMANPLMNFRVGPYSYQIKRDGVQSVYSVSDGKETIAAPILFALGQGKAGQTYVFQHDGAFYETRVSFFNEVKGLDFTIGHARNVPATLNDALGRRLSETEAADCLGCHSSGGVRGKEIRLDKLVTGVRCEACHGPGGRHVAASKAGEPAKGPIFSGRLMGGDKMTQDFCAACHQGSDNSAISKVADTEVNSIRFQPYRLFHSKCYSDDRRIGCTGCHDPHQPLRRDAAYYDSQCLTCHALKGAKVTTGTQAACPVATKDCTSCHMPKVRVDEAHFSFTDHYIRVVRRKTSAPSGN